VPFVSKATGRALAKVAARCMAGQSLKSQGVEHELIPPYFSVKEAVFPFVKFQGVDTILGPEMKSTGEVMGVGYTFAEAFEKSQLAAGVVLPTSGKAFISVRNADKRGVIEVAQILEKCGFEIIATKGTAAAICAAGITAKEVKKVQEGRPNIVDMIKDNQIALVVNTVEERQTAIRDSYQIRRAALQGKVATYTTIAGAWAAAMGISDGPDLTPYSLQSLQPQVKPL
jgi:carbamoyl-phosphate synthase large subunit